MALKLFLNVLYTIGIFVCLAVAYWGYQHSRYEFVGGGIFVAIVFVILKLKLLKEVRGLQKK